jgi:hypothetical protein
MLAWIKIVVTIAATWGLILGAIVASLVAPGVAHAINMYVFIPVGASICLRWLTRWALRRYRSAPGPRGFVPRKAPWAQ